MKGQPRRLEWMVQSREPRLPFPALSLVRGFILFFVFFTSGIHAQETLTSVWKTDYKSNSSHQLLKVCH